MEMLETVDGMLEATDGMMEAADGMSEAADGMFKAVDEAFGEGEGENTFAGNATARTSEPRASLPPLPSSSLPRAIVVVPDVVGLDGLLDTELLTATLLLLHQKPQETERDDNAASSPPPVVSVFKAVRVRAVVVACPSLREGNAVDSARTCGVDISRINMFGLATLPEIDIGGLEDVVELTRRFDGPIIQLSPAVSATAAEASSRPSPQTKPKRVREGQVGTMRNVDEAEGGIAAACGGLTDGHEGRSTKPSSEAPHSDGTYSAFELLAIAAGNADAILFWHEYLGNGGNVLLSTGPTMLPPPTRATKRVGDGGGGGCKTERLPTADCGSHYRQAAALLPAAIEVMAGDTLRVGCTLDFSSLSSVAFACEKC
jgi:hypothetical protein